MEDFGCKGYRTCDSPLGMRHALGRVRVLAASGRPRRIQRTRGFPSSWFGHAACGERILQYQKDKARTRRALRTIYCRTLQQDACDAATHLVQHFLGKVGNLLFFNSFPAVRRDFNDLIHFSTPKK